MSNFSRTPIANLLPEHLAIYAQTPECRPVRSSYKPPMSSLSSALLLLLPLLLATAAMATANTTTTVASVPAAVRTDADGGRGPHHALSQVPPAAATLPWPEQYHAVVITNMSAHGGHGLQVIELYYDWPRGRDLNIVRGQLARAPQTQWNVEWANGTAFLWDAASCSVFQFAVGLLPPDWKAQGAAYLGRERADGFDCHVWSNFVFERYYEDVATGRPVSWTFDGMQRHVLSFEAGAVMQDSSKWQAPAYCFTSSNGGSGSASTDASSS